MERINIETINYIAKLAKLKFTEEESKEFAKEFQDILSHFKNIDSEDLSEIKEEIEEKVSVIREDKVLLWGNKDELFQNTKGFKDGYIIIPKVIE